MRFVLRTDVSKFSGTGHLMRCIAIFQEIQKRGFPTIFIGSVVDVPWAKQVIEDFGFIQVFHDQESFIGEPQNDILIIDSYVIPINDPFLSRDSWRKIIALSDEHAPKYQADLYVRPTLNNTLSHDAKPRILVGPSFFPIRNQVKKIEAFENEPSMVDLILVGGGTDYKEFSSTIATCLKDLKIKFKANFFSDDRSIEKMDSRFRVFKFGTDIDSLLSDSSIAITTASTSAIEFIAREVPTGIVQAIDNQKDYYQFLSNQFLAKPLGIYRKGLWKIDTFALVDFISNLETRSKLRSNIVGLIDLKGVIRIVDEIIDLLKK
jgi:spore coat polysaccharide biosynthesis predicted glycosyltransferase SpsG